jgi:hypothetical protein
MPLKRIWGGLLCQWNYVVVNSRIYDCNKRAIQITGEGGGCQIPDKAALNDFTPPSTLQRLQANQQIRYQSGAKPLAHALKPDLLPQTIPAAQ